MGGDIMRIFARQALRFDHPQKAEAPVFVRALDFSDVPDWVAESMMFKWAEEEGTVMRVDSKADEMKAENAAADPELKALRATAKELGIPGYTKMSKEQLTQAIEAAKAS